MRFRTSLILISVTSLAIATAVACGDSSAPVTPVGDGGSAPVDASKGKGDSAKGVPGKSDADVSACMASATAECATQAMCNAPVQNAQYGSESACVGRVAILCETALATPNSAATAAQTAECGKAVASETCVQQLDQETQGVCLTLKGKGATGSACSHPAQCASAFCAFPPQSSCGKCAAPPKAGDSCLDLATCGQGLACQKGVCVAFVQAVASTCDEAHVCGAGVDCVMKAGATSGICETSGFHVGDTCDPTLETGAGCYTEEGFYCVAEKASGNYGTCQKTTAGKAGDRCGKFVGVDCVDSSCIRVGDAGATCVSHAADNAACDTVTGPDCVPPARCIGKALDGGTSGKCTLPVTTCP